MSTAYTGPKPRLSFWQIWNMCFGFFGIQFGWSLQMGNMSAIYEFLGAEADAIPGLWLAAPMTGLLVQPIVGYLSDRTWHPTLGRRRPFFLVGAILSSLALFIMPNSSAVWMAAGTLWILDSCINITMEPFRAFVADNLDEEQQSFGYAMQSMFIGAASFIAGFLPGLLVDWIGVSREKGAGGIPQNIMWSFYIGSAVFLVAVLYTVFKSQEYPPSDPNWKEKKTAAQTDLFSGLQDIFQAIGNMPGAFKRLALVQFLTWPGLFLMWFYYSTGVAADIFGGDAQTNAIRYTEGLEYANKTSAILNLVTFAFSFTIPFWVVRLGKKWAHTFCLLLGGMGLISVNFIHEPWMLYVSMSLVGIAWASILSMPYSILAGSIPAEKTGIYMGVFNFFIVLPEIIAALSFGKIMENHLHNDRLLAVLIGGILLCTAALACALLVKDSSPKTKTSR
ncbi:MAG: SLC45 family MFS transporter [Bacteroidetes bacterium]|nr:SLC45 family MFS transporter [Bacteroidota bacterium]